MHTFPNGKRYIGITKQELNARFDNGNGYKNNPMKRAIKKYKWENVKHDLLFDNLTKEQAEQSIENAFLENKVETKVDYSKIIGKEYKVSHLCFKVYRKRNFNALT